MSDFILIVDDDQDFIDELQKQANASDAWRDKCLMICFDQDEDDVIDVLEHHAHQITAVFLDFDLRYQNGEAFGAEKFMEATKEHLDWDKVRCIWFSGDEDLNQAKIQQAKAKFRRLDVSHIGKPFSFLQLVARLVSNDKIPQWQGFPLPLRVINRQAQDVYSNEHWRIARNEPAPELFIKESEFDEGEREFYGRHPDGNIKEYPEFNHFRLVSTVDESGQYLLQFAQGLAGLETTKQRNKLDPLIEKICIALNGHGFKRVRLYRYYSVPKHYEENQHEDGSQNIKGFMPLYYTNTELRFNKSGKQLEKHGSQNCSGDSCATSERGDWLAQAMKQPSNHSELLIYKIDEEPNLKELCDLNTIPEDAENSQSVLELPLITSSKKISDITQHKLLGLLVVDRYDEQTHYYAPITDVDVNRLEHTLLAYCRALTYSLELEIQDKDSKTKIEYADFDQEFLNDLQNPNELLKHLLAKAIKASDAEVGYITEPYQSDSYKITVATGHKLFQGYVFSNQANDLPVVKCWHTGKLIALPNLRKEAVISEKIVAAYENLQLVWHSEKNESVADGDTIRDYLENKMESLVALPVLADNQQIAAIILHAKEPYHFNYEKLNLLEYLTIRVGLVLMIARHIQRRQLFLDGVIHEIKSDVGPLKQALNSLVVDDSQHSIYLRAKYCATRLDMASKNLLLMTRNIPFDLTKTSCLSEVLLKICELYENDIHDKKITLLFEPEPNDEIWTTPIAMSIEWLTHVIANLLDNAVKYTNRDNIIVSAQINDRQLILCLANSGTMNENELASVFSADYRSTQGSGFHVGLASCKRIMQAHHGDIQLKNTKSQIHAIVIWLLANSLTFGEKT